MGNYRFVVSVIFLVKGMSTLQNIAVRLQCSEIYRIRVLFATLHFFADAIYPLPGGIFFVYAGKNVLHLCLMGRLNFPDFNISSIRNKFCEN